MITKADVTFEFTGEASELVPVAERAVRLGCDVFWDSVEIDRVAIRVHPNTAFWPDLAVVIRNLLAEDETPSTP